jgi:hypothetical protein
MAAVVLSKIFKSRQTNYGRWIGAKGARKRAAEAGSGQNRRI